MKRYVFLATTLLGVMWSTAAMAATPGIRVLPSGGLRGESAALALRGQQGGTLQFEMLALSVPPDGKAGVPIVLELLGSDLLENTEGFARVEVALYALSEQGALGGSLLRVVEIDTNQHGAALAASGLKLVARLPLGAGRWTLRGFVRSLAPGGRVSLRTQPLVIESNPANATVSPPLVEEQVSHWLVAALDEGGDALVDGAETLPSARLLMSSGARIEAVIATRNLNPRARLDVRFVSLDGNEVAIRRLEGAQRLRAPAVGVELARGSIDLGGLPEGDLELQVVANTPTDAVSGRPGESFASSGLPIAIAAGRLPAHIATWAEAFGGGSTNLPAPDQLDEASSRSARLSIPRDELERDLRAAFALLATGRDIEARAALVELESRALAGSGAAVPALAKAELALCRDLAKRDPEALVPLALLWLDIYRAERARRSFLISTHARMMLAAVADLYVQVGSGDGAKILAARLHAILGAELQDAGLTRLATASHERALALDPANELAALSLATELEKRGATAEMLVRLQALVAARPDHREALLRLGIAELRLGRSGVARQRLGRLVADDAPADWIYSIAAQELFRFDLKAKRWDDAEAMAKRALARIPGNEKLILGLAALDDLRGRSREARIQLERIPRPETAGAGERARYGEPPKEALGRIENEVRESAAPRRDRLAASLGLSHSEVPVGPAGEVIG